MGLKGLAEKAAHIWPLEMRAQDYLIIFHQPGSLSCKGFKVRVL